MESPRKVLIVQADNRIDTLDFLTLTRRTIQEKILPALEKYQQTITYKYNLIQITPNYYQTMHPATSKIKIVQEILNGKHGGEDSDVIVFLDSDAWINAPDHLHDLITYLLNDPTKHGCFSRDPCKIVNTYINSGSFILKINEYTRQMYEIISTYLETDTTHHYAWPYDQYYISEIIHTRKSDFIIFTPEILNTPYGIILKHNWWKNNRMYYDLYEALDSQFKYPILKPMTFSDFFDHTPFPNTDDSGLNYQD
jgi:hypothetical protein